MSPSDLRSSGMTGAGDRLATLAVILGVAALAPFGAWALVAPRSFFDAVATFEPYNQHLVQDVGAFQLGLGAVLLLARRMRSDGLAAALLGSGIASLAHTASHVVGHDLGGTPARDIPTFAAVTALLLAAGAVRARAGAPRRPSRSTEPPRASRMEGP